MTKVLIINTQASLP